MSTSYEGNNWLIIRLPQSSLWLSNCSIFYQQYLLDYNCSEEIDIETLKDKCISNRVIQSQVAIV